MSFRRAMEKLQERRERRDRGPRYIIYLGHEAFKALECETFIRLGRVEPGGARYYSEDQAPWFAHGRRCIQMHENWWIETDDPEMWGVALVPEWKGRRVNC